MPQKIKLPPSRRKRRWRKVRPYFLVTILICCCMPIVMSQLVAPTQPKVKQETIKPRVPLTSSQQIAVLNHLTNEVMALDFEEYITGVVSAEMPASFELEALKAQAVAARTFAYSRLLQANESQKKSPNDPVITTDPATCQAWISPEEQIKRWGSNYPVYSEKIAQAVSETKGQLVTYQGKPIEPLYHASCGGGKTESAGDVWGGQRPYLVSVPCNHPADKHSGQQVALSLAQMDHILGTNTQVLPASSSGKQKIIHIDEVSSSNRVKEVTIGGETFSGSTLRSLLGLKSTLITYKVDKDQIIFTTNGYGHGVGMCQYGANYYAQQGYDYKQILQHYYLGTEVN